MKFPPLQAIFNIPGLFDRLAQNIYDVLPIILYYNHYDPSVRKSITDKINNFYFQNNLTRDKEENVTNVRLKWMYFNLVNSLWENNKLLIKNIFIGLSVNRRWMVSVCDGPVFTNETFPWKRIANLCISFNSQGEHQLFSILEWTSRQILWYGHLNGIFCTNEPTNFLQFWRCFSWRWKNIFVPIERDRFSRNIANERRRSD